MKVSDIKLDLATGDASIDDAYIMESVGKVKVSSAIFDAADKLYDLPNMNLTREELQTIQEAALAQNLPLTQEGNVQVAHRAFLEAALGTGNAIKSSARKTYNQIAKKSDMLVTAVAKWVDAPQSNVVLEYATNISKSVIAANRGRDIELEDEKIMDVESVKCITEAYIQGAASTLKSYGLSTSSIFDLDSVQALGIDDNSGSTPKTPEAISRKLDASIKLMTTPEPNYTKKISAKDIGTYVLATDAIKNTAKALASASSVIDEGAENMGGIVSQYDKITDAERNIMSGGKFTKLAESIADTSSKICGMVGDTAYALTSGVQRAVA